MSELRDRVRGNLLRYSEMAYRLLPDRSYPRVLDIGCGSGVPTLFLARLTDSRIVALDHDLTSLEVLRRRIEAEGLESRVTPLLAPLEEIPLPEGSFHLLWCEGALHVLGFRESLRRWRRLLAPGGYLVAHDDALDLGGKADAAEEEGYVLHALFVVPEEVWWRDYCAPAEAELAGMEGKEEDPDPDHAALREEIRRFRESPESFRSAYFILERSGHA